MPLKVIPRRDRKLNRAVKKGEARSLRKGEVLYRTGDPADALVLVRSGHLQLANPVPDNRSDLPGGRRGRVLAVAGPWELTGEEGLFPRIRRRTDARAGERAQVVLLDGPAVNRALRTASKTYGAFLLAKEEELVLARKLGEPRGPGQAAENLAALLGHLSHRLGKEEEGRGSLIPIRLTHQVLADLSGSHRSTVTTLLNEWIYEGILMQEGGYIRILRSHELPS